MLFDPGVCRQYVEMLLEHDEVERALLVLDNVPAYFRDNPPEGLATLRQEIIRERYTAHRYQTSPNDALVLPELSGQLVNVFHRSRIVRNEVQRYNSKGVTPNLVEMGPGTYFLPFGLLKLGCRFHYRDIGVNEDALGKTDALPRGFDAAAPSVFVAHELIEHLPEPRDIASDAFRHCQRAPERIHLSTPCYTFDVNHPDWRTSGGLPHLRAYTPDEFVSAARDMFPGYHWSLFTDRIMVLRGQRADCFDETPLTAE